MNARRNGSRWTGMIVLLLGLTAFLPWAAAETDSPDSVIATYQRAIQLSAQDVNAYFNLGLAYYKQDRFEEAISTLEKCLQVNTQDQDAHAQVDGPAEQLLGIIYYSHKQDDRRAIEKLKSSLKYIPSDPDTFYALGLAYTRLKQYPEAIENLQTVLKLGRDNDPEVWFQLARVQLSAGSQAEAIISFQQTLKVNPEFKPALEELAVIYHQQKQDEDAFPLLKRLEQLEPDNFNANYLLGLYYFHKKMYPEMVEAYNRAVAIKPDLSDAYYNLGMAYYYQTRYDLAIESLKKAVGLNPKDAEAFNLLGQAQSAAVEADLQQASILIAQERYTDAMKKLEKVLALDPSQRKAKALMEDLKNRTREELASHLQRAKQFLEAQNLEEAFNEYELAIKMDPDCQEAKDGMMDARVQISKLLAQRVSKGQAAEAVRDYREALRHYDSALKLKPDYLPAQDARAELYAKLKARLKTQFADAQEQVQNGSLRKGAAMLKSLQSVAEALQDEAWSTKIMNSLAQLNSQSEDAIQQALDEGRKAFQAGDPAKARLAFNRVLALDPQNRAANDYILKITGSTAQVKVLAEKIKATYYQGVDYYVKGKIEEAILEWQKVVEMDPDNQDARINIDRAKAKLAAIRKLTQGQ